MREPVVLLTGGSGLVGSCLVPLLLQSRPGQHVVIISREPGAVRNKPGITVLLGDLRRDDLGLGNSALRELHARTTEVIHCAAHVKFSSSIDAARAVNTKGAEHVLDFAQRCPSLEKFAHISTLYICGRRPGLVREEALSHKFGYFNAYEQSKHEAEDLVFERMDRLPISIYRLSSIIGALDAGPVSQHHYFHSLIRLIPLAAEAPVLPGDPAAPVDLIANDWCASAFARLYRDHFSAGSVHHLCAGPEASLSVEELFDRVFGFFEERTGLAVMRPRLVTLDEFEDFKSAHRRNGKHGIVALLDTVSQFLPHLAIHQPFDTGRTATILAHHRLSPPVVADLLDRVLDRIVPKSTVAVRC